LRRLGLDVERCPNVDGGGMEEGWRRRNGRENQTVTKMAERGGKR
jgi:hypothetical protein